VERELIQALAERGYEPYDDETIRLRKCPFDSIAAENRDLVCGMNLAVMEGAIDALTTRPCVLVSIRAPASAASRSRTDRCPGPIRVLHDSRLRTP
jgi:predicted ArsR family transcriptional regulator